MAVKNYFLVKNRTTGRQLFDLNYFSVIFELRILLLFKGQILCFFEQEKKIIVYNSNCLSSYGNCTSYYCSLFVSVLKKALNSEGTQKIGHFVWKWNYWKLRWICDHEKKNSKKISLSLEHMLQLHLPTLHQSVILQSTLG